MSEDRELNVGSSFTTRRAALGATAAMTAGLLAEKALSPDSAHAEGVTSVDGKTGVVTGVLTGLVAAPSTASTEAEKATANTTAIQNAINAAEGPIYLQKGTYVVNKLTLKAGTQLIGAGIEGTVLKLKAGVKDNLLESENFLKLTEEYEKGEHTNKAFGPAHISVANLTLDGNKANNASPETYKGACIALNACSWIVENIHCRNAGASGFTSYCSEEVLASGKTEGSYESVVRGVTCYSNTNSGFVFEGPSSSRISDLHCINNGSGSAGIKACGTTSYWTNCRSWGFQKWAWEIQGNEHLVNCAAEEGIEGSLYINGSHVQWVGGFIDSQGEVPKVALIAVGHSGETPEQVVMEGFRSTCQAGKVVSLNLEYVGKNCRFSGLVSHTPAEAAIKLPGSIPEGLDLNLLCCGGTTTKPIRRGPTNGEEGFFGHAAVKQPAKPEATAAALLKVLEELGLVA